MTLILSFGEDAEGVNIGNDTCVRLVYQKERLKKHEAVITVSDPRLTSEHIATLWSDELENANYHGWVDVPEKTLSILREEGIAPEILKVVMFRLMTEAGMPD